MRERENTNVTPIEPEKPLSVKEIKAIENKISRLNKELEKHQESEQRARESMKYSARKKIEILEGIEALEKDLKFNPYQGDVR